MLLHLQVEIGGTSWLLAIAVDNPQNIVEQCKIETTTPKETLDAAIAWLQTQNFDAIGKYFFSFGFCCARLLPSFVWNDRLNAVRIYTNG